MCKPCIAARRMALATTFSIFCLHSGGQSLASAATPPTDAAQKRAASAANKLPVPYIAGAGDMLSIFVWNEKELSQTLTVRPDGYISMPLIGEIEVLGNSPSQIESLLRDRLKAIVVNPRVTVNVVEIRSRTVYITGEVARPGAYPLNTPLDVLQLIAQAGGLTQFASRKNIRIVTANGPLNGVQFDYNKLVHGKDSNRRILLNPGDTVVVP